MVLVDIVREPVARPSIAGLLRAAVRWVAAVHAARQRRAALEDLLFAPEHRLRDLGISREELIEAIEHRR